MEFNFSVADLGFTAKKFKSLEVNGHRATYKGVGQINGEGRYRFRLRVLDADLKRNLDTDRFWIKIWEVGGDLIYDNNVDAADDDEDDMALSTEIRAGDIKIQRKTN